MLCSSCLHCLVSANVSLWPIDHTTTWLCFGLYLVFFIPLYWVSCSFYSHCAIVMCMLNWQSHLGLLEIKILHVLPKIFIKLVTLSPGRCFYKFPRYKMSLASLNTVELRLGSTFTMSCKSAIYAHKTWWINFVVKLGLIGC